jgi:NAD(P) transhydrogenase
MSDFDYDLICIGSGPAGQRAAVQAAKLGKHVAVIERQRFVGGVCVDKGTIPSKTFREAVISYTGFGRRFISHTGQVAGAKIASEDLLRGVTEVVQREWEIVERQLRRNNVEMVRGVASFQGPHSVVVASESGSRSLSGEKILIAVGSKPGPITKPDYNRDIVVTSDDLPFMKKLPETLTVIGAGVIGIEYASMYSALGVRVSVVDRRSRFLEFLDHEIVDELMNQMRRMDVEFHLGKAVAGIEMENGARRRGIVRLESGENIFSDLILYSIGRVGAIDELCLEKVGLAGDEKGRLKVNRFFQTEIPHIYAAGDVIGFPSLAATSSEQGRIAARHAFTGCYQEMEEHFPLGIYSVPEISMVGKTEHELAVSKKAYTTGIARYREIARGQILGDDSGMLKMLFDRNQGHLLGVHAIGTGATELIHIGQAVLRLDGGIDYFLHTVFNYPTLAECYKVAALNAANKLAI